MIMDHLATTHRTHLSGALWSAPVGTTVWLGGTIHVDSVMFQERAAPRQD
jgi:hypothetical protein